MKALTFSQKTAIENCESNALIIAGAGAGKTLVLTEKIRLCSVNSPLESLLVLTFTNKAANELKERLKLNLPFCGTFHSICLRILKIEFPEFDFTIITPGQAKTIIKKICKDLNIEEEIEAKNISFLKNKLIIPELCEKYKPEYKFITNNFISVFSKYTKYTDENFLFDYDDLLLVVAKLFKNKEIQAKWQKQFKYIFVDEYQDTNTSQNFVLKKLVSSENKIYVVGDDAQSIYGFRGAVIQNIMNFPNNFKAPIFNLPFNFRSTNEIVKLSNYVINQNNGNFKKKNVGIEGKSTIVANFFSTEKKEIEYIIKRIKEAQKETHAVLFRNSAIAKSIMFALDKEKMKYKKYGVLSFLDRKIIKNFIELCNTIINPTNFNFLNEVGKLKGFGIKTLEKLENYPSLFNRIKTGEIPPFINNSTLLIELVNFITEVQNLIESVPVNEILKKIEQRFLNDSDFKVLTDFFNNYVDYEQDSFKNYINNIHLNTEDKNGDAERILISTIHSVKGLEFDNVYIVGMEKSFFPSPKSDIEEERRLLYVAITRAKNNLYFSTCESRNVFGKVMKLAPSVFFSDIEKFLTLKN